MQTGFLLLEVGVIRKKNARYTVLKNFLDMCIVTVTFCFFGFGVSRGGAGGLFGSTSVFDINFDDINYGNWIISYAFCSTTCTIVSGALAERCILETYVCFTFIMSSIIYPVISCWTWGGGWLGELGFHDHAGSGVVHMTAGFAGIIGTVIMGPRIGFFKIKAPLNDSIEYSLWK